MTAKAEPTLDLAVVGGGVAGAYVAYRVAPHRPGWRVGLFERSERIGGRLLSLRPPRGGEVRAELGGMRFRTSQPHVSGLVEELGLEARPFLTVHDDNRFFLRGGRWRAADPGDAALVYALEDSERGLSPSELLVAAFERIVPGATTLSDDDWIKVKQEHRFEGRPLREWSMGDALAAVLSAEGHRYVVDGFGYTTLFEDRNAADAIPWVLIEARPESENRTLVDGMERLPRELAERFSAAGGEVFLDHELLGFDELSDATGDAFALRFADRPDVIARRVVIAAPRTALERIARGTPPLGGSEISALVRSVSAHPAAKLCLVYDRPWWRDAGVDGMRAVSGLNLSKTYYFDRRDRREGSAPAVLLASYSDGPNREAWCSLRDGSFRPDDTHPYASERRWESYAASADQLAEAVLQLRALHEVEHIPPPIASAFVDWGAEPFGGAWHVWNAGVRSWDVMERILQPVPGREVYVCGEAYSWSQGWVEGALETADRVTDRLLA